jgi:curved DNA-binding protein CbpA
MTLQLKGRLQDEPLPLVLHQVHGAQATGTLRLETRVGRHEVFFRQGFPVAVRLPGSAELLGKVLVEMGILDEETHKRTMAEPPPKGMKYGEWLVERKLVTAEHMRLALKAQVRRKLHRLFFLNDGQFDFAAGEHEEGREGQEALKIHPWRAIYQGVRSAWNGERLSGALFLLDGKAIKLTVDEAAAARYGIGQEDGRIAELLRKGHWTVPDLIEAVGLPVQPVHALVYAFYITEALDVKNADEVPRLRRKPGEQSVAAPMPQAAAPRTDVSVARRVVPPMAAAPGASVHLPGMTPPPGTNLRSKIATPPRGVEPSGAHAVPQAPLDPREARKLIETKAKVVEHENLFEVLGVPDTATKDQVKAAYFEAAKRFHPDRLSSLGLEALRPETEKIFRRVSEAYSTLTDDARRDEYKKTLSKPAAEKESPEAHAKAMKILEAEMAFKRGEILMRKNDYAGAIGEFEQSIAGNPQDGEPLAWLAFARVCAGQLTYPDAKARFQEATKLSPKCGRAFYFLGLSLKEEKDFDRAYTMFRKAHELDARLLDAEREMRLINMRKEKSSGGGWFSRKK